MDEIVALCVDSKRAKTEGTKKRERERSTCTYVEEQEKRVPETKKVLWSNASWAMIEGRDGIQCGSCITKAKRVEILF